MKRTIVLLLLVTAGWPSAAAAQPPTEPQPTVIALRPVAEPVPALRYRLVPEHINLVPGNAAIFYHRGVIILKRLLALREKEQSAAWCFPALACHASLRYLAQLPDRRDPAR